jgi:hypothetical protein
LPSLHLRTGIKIKFLKVFTNEEEGTVSYSLVSPSGGAFAISNMQCGWRGPLLPDNTYEYKNNRQLLSAVIEAVNGGVQKLRIPNCLFKDLFVYLGK